MPITERELIQEKSERGYLEDEIRQRVWEASVPNYEEAKKIIKSSSLIPLLGKALGGSVDVLVHKDYFPDEIREEPVIIDWGPKVYSASEKHLIMGKKETLLVQRAVGARLIAVWGEYRSLLNPMEIKGKGISIDVFPSEILVNAGFGNSSMILANEGKQKIENVLLRAIKHPQRTRRAVGHEYVVNDGIY